jgi:hypothetical protein
MVFATVDGEEVEVFPGVVLKDATTISMRRVIRERTYAIGEPIRFDHDSLSEAAFGCFLFGADLVAKLPQRKANVSE